MNDFPNMPRRDLRQRLTALSVIWYMVLLGVLVNYTASAASSNLKGIASSGLLSRAIGANLLVSSPKVIATLPKSDQRDVALNVRIALIFDQDLDISSVTDEWLSIRTQSGQMVTGGFRVTESGDTLIFTPESDLLSSTSYRVTLTKAAKAANGIAIEDIYSWLFTTVEVPVKVEQQQPTIVDLPQEAMVEVPPKTSQEKPQLDEVFPDPSISLPDVPVPLVTVPELVIPPVVLKNEDAFNITDEGELETATSLAIAYILPAKNANDVVGDSVVSVVFSDDINQQDFQLVVQTQSGSVVSGVVQYGPRVITFTPDELLSPNLSFIVKLFSELDNLSFDNELTWNFTTNSNIERVAKDPQTNTPKLTVFVKNIRLMNNSLIPKKNLAQLVAPYINREVTSGELRQLSVSLSQTLFKHGYVNTGVVIPNQKIQDGMVTFEVIQGKLSHIRLKGNEHVSDTYINRRVTLGALPPLNYFKLQRSLALLQEDPLIDSVSAKLVPGAKLGESELQLEVNENLPYQVGLAIDNYHSPSVGTVGVSYYGSHGNLTGLRDQLKGSFVRTEGYQWLDLAYNIPFNIYNTRLGVSFANADVTLIEDPIREANKLNVSSTIENNVSLFGVMLSHPLFDTLPMKVLVSMGLDKKTVNPNVEIVNEDTQKNDPVLEAYVLESELYSGKKNITQVWAGLTWTQKFPSSVLSIQGKVNAGIDALGATVSQSAGPDGLYKSVTGQLYGVYYLNHWLEKVMLRTRGQWGTTVLPSEKFAIGGINSIRGYRENRYLRDNGIQATLELHFPIERLTQQTQNKLSLVPFIDYGRVWDTDYALTKDNLRTALLGRNYQQIYSVGLGIVWRPKAKLQGELFWGKALVDNGDAGNTLQEQGLHLKLAYQFF